MISNSEIKLVRSLKLKKFRQKYNLFVAEGDRSVRTMLNHGQLRLHRLYAISDLKVLNIPSINPGYVSILTAGEMKKISLLRTPSNIIALFEIPVERPESLENVRKVLYLDDIQDPGNLGTIIRIADWYGLDAIVRSESSADFYNPKVVQASMGSLGHLQLATIPGVNFKKVFDGFIRIGASLDGDRSIQKGINDPICLVIGNEGQGITDEILQQLSYKITIPGAPGRTAESLNAGVATGILCQILFGSDL